MKQMTKAAAAAIFLAIPVLAFAGVSENAWMEGAKFEQDLPKIKDKMFRILPEEAMTWTLVEARRIPPSPAQDAFLRAQECLRLDGIRFVRAPSLDEALGLMSPCLKGLSDAYGVPVRARRGIISSGWTMGGPEGILIKVGQPIPLGNPVIRDLNRSLELRKNRLLGHPAKLDNSFQGMPSGAGKSSLQATIDSCVLPAVYQPVNNAEDFIRIYEPCLRQDKSLAITDVTASRKDNRTVWLFSRADRATLKAMNGLVRVPGENGTVAILIQAFPTITIQPFGL